MHPGSQRSMREFRTLKLSQKEPWAALSKTQVSVNQQQMHTVFVPSHTQVDSHFGLPVPSGSEGVCYLLTFYVPLFSSHLEPGKLQAGSQVPEQPQGDLPIEGTFSGLTAGLGHIMLGDLGPVT